MKRIFPSGLWLAGLFLTLTFLAPSAKAQIIYQHDFGTIAISGNPYSVPPPVLDPHLSNSQWSTTYGTFTSFNRGSGKVLGLGNATISGDIINLTISISSGYVCSISGISFWSQRSNTGHPDLTIKINNGTVYPSFTVPTTGKSSENTSLTEFNNLENNVTITFLLTGAAGSTGTFRIDDFTLYGTVTPLPSTDVTSIKDGDWFTSSTWNTNTVPTADKNVLIKHAVTTDATITRNSGTTTTISKDHSLAVGATYTNNGTTNVYGTFQLDAGGYADGNDFVYGTESYLVFNGENDNYGINSGQKFWPQNNGPQNVTLNSNCAATLNDGPKTVNGKLELNAGFTNNNSITVNGKLVINPNGFIDNNSPIYGSASSLIYQYNGTHNIWKEWTNTTPHNVQLTGSTTLNYTNVQQERTITGNLVIDAGSALYMDWGDDLQSYPLTVDGNVDVFGSLSLGDKYGDDLITAGDITFQSGYTFNPNERAIVFIKEGTQKISTPSNSALTIPYIVIGKESGTATTVLMQQGLVISAPNGDKAIDFKSANGKLSINGYELTIGSANVGNFIEGNGSFKGSSSSKIKLLGNGDVGVLRFTDDQTLQSLIIDRTSNQTAATLGSDLTLSGTGNTFTNGILNIADYNLTFDKNSGYFGGNNLNSFIQADANGKVYKQFNNAGSFIYPIGDQTSGIDYSPASISFSYIDAPVRVGINVRDAKHPNVSSTNYLTRYWNVSSDGSADYSADAKFYYTTSDVNGTESTLITAGFTSPNWYLGNNANTSEHSLSVTGEDDLNRSYTGADQFSPIAIRASGYYQSITSGNWSDVNVWQVSSDKSNWIAATQAPTSAAKSITIRSTHIIKLTQDESARLLTIEVGGTLTNEDISGGHLLSVVHDGSSVSDFDIKGTYILFGKQPTLSSNAKATIYSGGIVRADNNNHPGESEEFARNSKVFFLTGSIFNWNTSNPFATSGLTYFANAINEIPIFKISKNVDIGGGSNTIFNCFTSIDANVTFSGAGTKYFRNGICGSGTLIDNSTGNVSRLEISGASTAVLGGNSLKLNLKNNLNLKTNVTVPKDSIVIITGANLDNNLSSNVFTINGTIDMTIQTFKNTNGTINLYGVYRTANGGGFSGGSSSIPSGTVNVYTGSKVDLYANGDQNLNLRNFSTLLFQGSGNKIAVGTFNSPIDNIIIKENAIVNWGIKKLNGPFTTNLTMTGGRLIVSAADISPTMNGVYDLTGGIIEFANNSQGTAQTIRSAPYKNIEITGSNVGNSDGNITLSSNGTFIVKKEAVFSINRNSITCPDGNAIVTVEKDGTFKTGNNKGFHGFASEVTTYSSIHQNITNIVLEKGSTVECTRMNDQPITNTNNLSYQNLVLSGSGNKIAPPDELFIEGDFSQTGSALFDPNGSGVTFSGSDVQHITTSGADLNFYNFNNENKAGLNIDSKIAIAKTFQPGDQSITILNNDIVLKSDATNTANVGIIPTGTTAATINYGMGRFVVERFIPKHSKAWQLLSVPTKGSAIKDSWQQSVQITNDRSDWSANGFDYYSQGGPSMKTYDPVSNTYVGVNSTSDLIDNVHGYFLFVRGDKTVSYGMEPTAVTLQTKGKLYAPTPSGETLQPIDVPANSFALIGNPYASSINFGSLGITNIDVSYYVWDPKLTTGSYSAYGVGGWRTISVGEVIPQGGDYLNTSIPAIQSGQAFFVHNISSVPGQVSFTEDAKTSGSLSIFKNTKHIPIASARISINLFAKNSNENILLDGALTLFGKEFSSDVDHLDAKKMWNAAENVSLPNGSYSLVIERKPLPHENDTMFINLTGMVKRDYLLEINSKELQSQYLEAYFHDRYTSRSQMLNEGLNTIGLSVHADKESSNKNRFFITFKKSIQTVAIINAKAAVADEDILINWKVIGQRDVVNYAIETSKDGTNFETAADVQPSKSSESDYSWTHAKPGEGFHSYRIKATLKDQSFVYSKIIKATLKYPEKELSVYPNPVVGQTLHLHFVRQNEGQYSIRVLDASGKIILKSVIHHSGFNREYKIKVPAAYGSVYFMEITKNGGIIFNSKLFFN